MNAQEIVERIMSAHWDLGPCGCWVCHAGAELGFAARGEYLPYRNGNRHLSPVPSFGWRRESVPPMTMTIASASEDDVGEIRLEFVRAMVNRLERFLGLAAKKMKNRRRKLRLYLGYCALGVSPRLAAKYAGMLFGGKHVLCRRCSELITDSARGLCFHCRKRCHKRYQLPKPLVIAPWIEQAVAEYQSGKTMAEIGKIVGRSRQRVRQVLKRAGIPKMSPKKRKECLGITTLTASERRRWITNHRKQQRFLLRVRAERLYCSGLSMNEVARELNLKHASNVHYLLGPTVKRRPVGCWIARGRIRPPLSKKWNDLLDGDEHTISLRQAYSNAFAAAAKRGLKITTRKISVDEVVIRAYRPMIE